MREAKHRAGILMSYVDMLLVIVAILIVSVAPKKAGEGPHVEAQYLVTIEWDKRLDDDVDLWAVGPPDPSKPCFYENLESGALSLDRDSRGYLDDRLTVDGKAEYLPHKEMITMRGVVPGRYEYGIHLYKSRNPDHGAGRDPRNLGVTVHLEVVRLNPKLTTLARRDFTLEFEGDAVNVWAMVVAADGSFVEVDPSVEPIVTKFYKADPMQQAALRAPFVP